MTDTIQLSENFSELIETISGFKQLLTKLQTQIKTLEKNTNKQVKQLQKKIKKTAPKNKRKPSGFAKPTKISNELCQFLEKPLGTEIARTEVTQHLISYIKTHNLQRPSNKKHIEPDNKLVSLLGLNDKDELTYFNLQGYMNKHFEKSS